MTYSLLTSTFTQLFQTPPGISVRAPGRVNLLGEHTDYNGGIVLPAAIDRYIWLAMNRRADNQVRFHAFDLADSYQGTIPVVKSLDKPWVNYLLGTIHELYTEGSYISGVNVLFGGDIPIGAGLSSSAALQCGMLSGLNRLFDLRLSNIDIIRLAQRCENRFVGTQCGIMDMFASVLGRTGHVLHLDCRNLDFTYLPFQTTRGYSLVLCDSGIRHHLSSGEYNTRRAECELGVRLLQAIEPNIQSLRDVTSGFLFSEKNRLPEKIFSRCRYVVEENARVEAASVALMQGDFGALGKLMNETHKGLRHLFEVTCPQTDFLAEEALRHAGTAGARQMGGGFGGCTLNLVHRETLDMFVSHMSAAYRKKFSLKLHCFPVEISDGLEVLTDVFK